MQRSALCRSWRELSNEYLLANLASIQPRTSLVKFARSPRTDPPGDSNHFCIRFLSYHTLNSFGNPVDRFLRSSRFGRATCISLAKKAIYGQECFLTILRSSLHGSVHRWTALGHPHVAVLLWQGFELRAPVQVRTWPVDNMIGDTNPNSFSNTLILMI